MSLLWKPLHSSARSVPNTTLCTRVLQRVKIESSATTKLTSISIHCRHHQTSQAPTRPRPLQNLAFWKCRHTWKRATVNTTRCLIGCSLGDLSTMYYLMTYHSSMNAATSMSLSSEQNQAYGFTGKELQTNTQFFSDCRHKHFDLARDCSVAARQRSTDLERCCSHGVWYEPCFHASDGVHREFGDIGPRRQVDESCRSSVLGRHGGVYARRISGSFAVQLLAAESAWEGLSLSRLSPAGFDFVRRL